MDHNPSENENNLSDIILEEGEEYDPPEQEIVGYALYLGFELPEDEDLLYIAKEGLKAPVPHPWEACQTEKGEIYYYNTVDKQSTWNHPLDDHYREVYSKAKTEKISHKSERSQKSQKSQKGQQKNHEKIEEKEKLASGTFNLGLSQDFQQTEEWIPKGAGSKENLSNFLESPIYSENQFEMFRSKNNPKSKEKEKLGGTGQSNRDIEDFKKKKQEEFTKKKKELEEIYQAKIDKAREENERQLASLKLETQEKVEEERQRLNSEMSARRKQSGSTGGSATGLDRNKKLEEFKEKMLEDLRKQKEATLEKLRGENEGKLTALREELAKKREDKVLGMREELKRKQEEELQPLKEKLAEVNNEVKKLKEAKEQIDKQGVEEERIFARFTEEQQHAFQKRKQELIQRYERSAQEMKEDEMRRYEGEIEVLIRESKSKNEMRMKEDQEKIKKELEMENQRKLKVYEEELHREIEQAKIGIIAKLEEVEKRKTEEVLGKLNTEYNNKLAEWAKEKAKEDEKFAKEKALLEQQYSSELMRYKAEFEKKIQNEIGELEAEKQEKLARINELDEMIGGFANRIDYNGPADISNLQAIYENRLVELNETLTKKNQELKILTSKKFHLLTEATSLKDKVELLKKECEDLQEQSDCTSLNNLLEHLTRKLISKEQELQGLKQERSSFHNQSQNMSHYGGFGDESKANIQPSAMDVSAISQHQDMEKIFKELESVKMVLEHEVDNEEPEEEEEEDSGLHRKKNLNQNKSFSHFGHGGRRSEVDKKSTARDAPVIESQIKVEVQQLLAQRSKILNDIAQFNKEFSDSDLTSEMRSYYKGIKALMDEKLATTEKKLQNLDKFLSWAHKLNEDGSARYTTSTYEKLNKTIMGDRDQNTSSTIEKFTSEDPVERIKALVNAKRLHRHSSGNRSVIDG